jgi:hypothetical protein
MHLGVVPVVAWCTLVNPAVDKIAGAFPKALPLQVVAALGDLGCAIVRPTFLGVLDVLTDVAQIKTDVKGRRSEAHGATYHQGR